MYRAGGGAARGRRQARFVLLIVLQPRQGLSLTSHATYIHLAGVHDHSTSMEEWLGDYQLTQELMTIVHPEPRSYSDCASSRQPPTDRSVATHVTPTPRHAQITQGVQQATRR